MAAKQIVQGFNNNIHKLMMAMVGRLTLRVGEVINSNTHFLNNNNREEYDNKKITKNMIFKMKVDTVISSHLRLREQICLSGWTKDSMDMDEEKVKN